MVDVGGASLDEPRAKGHASATASTSNPVFSLSRMSRLPRRL